MLIRKITFIIFLLSAAWEDKKSKTVHCWLFTLFGALGSILWLWMVYLNIRDLQSGNMFSENILPENVFLKWGGLLLAGMIPGVFLLLTSKLTSGAMGLGDAWFFIVSGLYLTIEENIGLLLSGIIFAGIFGMIVFMRGRKKGLNAGKETMPFLVFLLPDGIWMIKDLVQWIL